MKISHRLLIVLMFLSVNFAFAQQTELENGITLYKQGKNNEAIAVLEKLSNRKETKTDAKVWNYLAPSTSAASAVQSLESASSEWRSPAIGCMPAT